VTNDETGIHFETVMESSRLRHKPLPVADPDDEDPPQDAVARPVAEHLVESNPLVCWGVACEHVTDDGDVCGRVFDSPKARNSHTSVHADDTDETGDGGEQA
jgi:hypothetical protein